MDNFVMTKILKMAAGMLIGGVSGYLYYRLVGCSSGACPITSNKFSAIIYGAGLGLLITLDK